MAGPILFWRDTLVVGSFANMVMSFISLMLLAKGHATAAVALHFSLMPFNVFMWLCIVRLPGAPTLMRFAATLWLALVSLI